MRGRAGRRRPAHRHGRPRDARARPYPSLFRQAAERRLAPRRAFLREARATLSRLDVDQWRSSPSGSASSRPAAASSSTMKRIAERSARPAKCGFDLWSALPSSVEFLPVLRGELSDLLSGETVAPWSTEPGMEAVTSLALATPRPRRARAIEGSPAGSRGCSKSVQRFLGVSLRLRRMASPLRVLHCHSPSRGARARRSLITASATRRHAF